MGDGDRTSGRWRGIRQLAKDFYIRETTLKRVIYGTTWPSKEVTRIWNLLKTTPTVTKDGKTFGELMPEEYEMRKELMAYPFVPQLAKATEKSLSFVDCVLRHKAWATEKAKAVWVVACGVYGEEIARREGDKFESEYVEWKQEKRQKEAMSYPFVRKLAEMTGKKPSFVYQVLRHKAWETEAAKAMWKMACDIYGVEIAAREGERFSHDYVEWKKQKREGARKWNQ